MTEPFFELEHKESSDDYITQERRASHPESSLIKLLQTQKSRIPLKKCNSNPWSVQVPKAGTGVCNCANLPSDKLVTSGTLASDLMKDEQRERVQTTESNNDKGEKTSSASAQSGAYNVEKEVKGNQAFCKSEQKGKQFVQKYQKNVPSGNVADCSARTLPKSLQNREKIKLKQLQNRISQAHSFSVDDLPLRLLKHRPSASFEEAIERGYTSDTYHSKSASISETEEDNVTKQNANSGKTSGKLRIPRNGIKRHKSLVSDSVLSDDVFLGENTIDNIYKGYLSDISVQPLPNKMSFRPLPTSSNVPHKLRNNSQRMTSLSFESESRRSSIELTRDELFVDNIDDTKDMTVENCIVNADDKFEPEVHEAFPVELFTEVNESTLAALKRHGSSINVAPSSENSPRTLTCKYTLPLLAKIGLF